MGFFDEWKLLFKKDVSEAVESPEIKKLREPQKLKLNERGNRVESADLFRRTDGLAGYASEAQYINSDDAEYKNKITERYSSTFKSYGKDKTSKLTRNVGSHSHHKIARPEKTAHSENFKKMGQLYSGKPAGMGPIGMEDNSVINDGNKSFSGAGATSSKLNRKF